MGNKVALLNSFVRARIRASSFEITPDINLELNEHDDRDEGNGSSAQQQCADNLVVSIHSRVLNSITSWSQETQAMQGEHDRL